MSGTETGLRELLEIAAGEPPASVSASEVRHLARRRRTMHTAVAAAAVACLAVSVAAAGAAGLVSGRPSAAGPSAAGAPRYYVQQKVAVRNRFLVYQPAVVRDTETGAVTASVSCPWPGATISYPVAPTGHEAFFLVCQRISGSGIHSVITGLRIYRFQLTAAGTVGHYSLVPGGTLPGGQVEGLMAAANGSEIVMQPSSFSWRPLSNAALLVINTRTGAHAVWYEKRPEAFRSLSLSPDGRDLRFLVSSMTSGPGSHQNIAIEQLGLASGGGSLSSARVLVRGSLPPGADLLMPDALASPGRSLLTVVENSGLPSRAEVTVEQISVATGKIARVLFRTAGIDVSASSDPTGRHIILGYDMDGLRYGWLNHGRLIPLAPAITRQELLDSW